MNISNFLKNVFYLILIITFAGPLVTSLKRFYQKTVEPHAQVGYIELRGMITSAEHSVEQLKKFFKNPDIKAIVLKIESPGGTAGSSETVFHELSELKKENPKPIVAVIENICASGAYWVACGTDHIIASPVAWVGSIGAYIPFRFKLKEFINQYKIFYESIQAGAYKSVTDPFVDLTPEQRTMLQDLANQTYEEFTQSVASRRPKLSINAAKDWANGKVFIGKKALELGLIDELGSLTNAITWIKEKSLIDGKIEWVKSEPETWWSSFFGSSPSDDTGSTISTRALPWAGFFLRSIDAHINALACRNQGTALDGIPLAQGHCP